MNLMYVCLCLRVAPVGRWTEVEKRLLVTRISNTTTTDRETRRAQHEMPDLKNRLLNRIRTRVWFFMKS
jgi:hypothetical protein